MTAVQQAELLEKQKSIQQRQQKLNHFTQQKDFIDAKQSYYTREKNRAVITKRELAKYPDTVNVYESVGRMFVKRDKAVMDRNFDEAHTTMTRNIQHCLDEKAKIQVHIEKEDVLIRREVGEFEAIAAQMQQGKPADAKK